MYLLIYIYIFCRLHLSPPLCICIYIFTIRLKKVELKRAAFEVVILISHVSSDKTTIIITLHV